MAEPDAPVKNEAVQEALDRWALAKNQKSFSDVMRRLLVGQLLLDATGSDLGAPGEAPDPNGLSIDAGREDSQGRLLLPAYTDNDRLQEAHPGERVISWPQPSVEVLRLALRQEQGLVIDPGTPQEYIAFREELESYLPGDLTAMARVTGVLLRQAPDQILRPALLALSDWYIPTLTERDDSGEVVGVGIPTATGRNGGDYGVACSNPAEALAWMPEADPRPTGLDNIVNAADRHGQQGIIINPLGFKREISMETLHSWQQR